MEEDMLIRVKIRESGTPILNTSIKPGLHVRDLMMIIYSLDTVKLSLRKLIDANCWQISKQNKPNTDGEDNGNKN